MRTHGGCAQSRRLCAPKTDVRAPGGYAHSTRSQIRSQMPWREKPSLATLRTTDAIAHNRRSRAQPTRSRINDEAARGPCPPLPARPSRLRSAPPITRRITFNNIYPQESFSKKSNSACYWRRGSEVEQRARSPSRPGERCGWTRGARGREAHGPRSRGRERPAAEKNARREERAPAAREARAARPSPTRPPTARAARPSPTPAHPQLPRELLVENGYARPRGVLTTAMHARNLHRCVNPGQRCCSALEYE